MRKRSREWRTRLTDEEFQKLVEVTEHFGYTRQEYGEKALFRRLMLTPEQQGDLEAMIYELQELSMQMRRIGTNVNQLTRLANTTGNLPAISELQQIRESLENYEKEVNEIWQLSRRLRARRPQSKD